MRRTVAPALVTLALLGVLAGCADTDPQSQPPADRTTPADRASPSDRTMPTTPPSAPATSQPASPPAGIIKVVVSGGIRGIHTVHRVERADPPPGLSPAEVDALFALAHSRQVRALDGKHARNGKDACCDRLSYALTIERPDGTRTDIVAVDPVSLPPKARQLLTRMQRLG